jgi:hypothetical protein
VLSESAWARAGEANAITDAKTINRTQLLRSDTYIFSEPKGSINPVLAKVTPKSIPMASPDVWYQRWRPAQAKHNDLIGRGLLPP